MANVISRPIEQAAAPLELDKAGVIVGFIAGLVAMLAYQHSVPEASAVLSVALVAASTWLGVKSAQALARVLR
jgi:hypothetical protein